MGLIERLRDDLKVSMRAKDQARTGTVRLLMASLQEERGVKRQRAIDQAVQAAGVELRHLPADQLPPEEPLTEAEMEQVVRRDLKKHQDAQDMYQKAGRAELATEEEQAIAILRTYLPAMLEPEEARARVAAIIAEMSSDGTPMGPSDMKRVMPVVMDRLRGQAEGRVLNQLVRELLSS